MARGGSKKSKSGGSGGWSGRPAPRIDADTEIHGVKIEFVADNVPLLSLDKMSPFHEYVNCMLQAVLDSSAKADSLYSYVEDEHSVNQGCLALGHRTGEVLVARLNDLGVCGVGGTKRACILSLVVAAHFAGQHNPMHAFWETLREYNLGQSFEEVLCHGRAALAKHTGSGRRPPPPPPQEYVKQESFDPRLRKQEVNPFLSAEEAAEWAALEADNLEQIQSASTGTETGFAEAESFLQEVFPSDFSQDSFDMTHPNGNTGDELKQSLERRMDYGDVGIGTHFGGKVLTPMEQEIVLEIGACEAFDFELPPEGTQLMFDVHRDSSDRLLALNAARCEFEDGDNTADGWPHVELKSIQALVQRFGDSLGLNDAVMDKLREARGSVQMAVIRLGPPEFDGSDPSEKISTRIGWVQNLMEHRSRAPVPTQPGRGKGGAVSSSAGKKGGPKGGGSDAQATYGGRARRVAQPNPPPPGHWPEAPASKSRGKGAASKHGHMGGSMESPEIASLKDAVVIFVTKGFYSEILGYKTRIMHMVRDPDVRAGMQAVGLHASQMKDWLESDMKREVKLKADPSCTYGYQVNMQNNYDPVAHMANVYLHGEAPKGRRQAGKGQPFRPSSFVAPASAGEEVPSDRKRRRKGEAGQASGRATYGRGQNAD